MREFDSARPSDIEGWTPILDALCKPLDLARPVMLSNHIRDLNRFARTVFRSADFMEGIDFDQFVIEIFPEEKKKTNERIIVETY
ncbi:MAG: hypothetical protein Q4C04_00790 [Clostridia bacterium]|nr:hypothetical protein [Clostridia bacterium]